MKNKNRNNNNEELLIFEFGMRSMQTFIEKIEKPIEESLKWICVDVLFCYQKQNRLRFLWIVCKLMLCISTAILALMTKTNATSDKLTHCHRCQLIGISILPIFSSLCFVFLSLYFKQPAKTTNRTFSYRTFIFMTKIYISKNHIFLKTTRK